MNDQGAAMETARQTTPRPSGDSRRTLRLKAMAGMGMMGFLIAGMFGHNQDNVSWAATLGASWLGGLLSD